MRLGLIRRTPLAALFIAACVCISPAGAAPAPVKVMLIGDSLSVGPFGRAMQSWLQQRYGANDVCVFASCGSSPEDWLPDTSVFVTPCGYRATTPRGSLLFEYRDGRKPRPVPTPKLSRILASYRPSVVIVQLGTNWMDNIVAAGRPDEGRYREIIADFIRELRKGASPPPTIVWVMPPASSKYPAGVHRDVEQWITDSAHSLGFRTINSRRITGAYMPGASGGDGVHYSDAAGTRWARGVMAKLRVHDGKVP